MSVEKAIEKLERMDEALTLVATNMSGVFLTVVELMGGVLANVREVIAELKEDDHELVHAFARYEGCTYCEGTDLYPEGPPKQILRITSNPKLVTCEECKKGVIE